jgi:Tfp pilus assembly pilus retraction ATPase PilT
MSNDLSMSIPGMQVSDAETAPSVTTYIAKICELIIGFIPTTKDIYVHEGQVIRVLSAAGMQTVPESMNVEFVAKHYQKPVTAAHIRSFISCFVDGVPDAKRQDFTDEVLNKRIEARKPLDRTIRLGNSQRLRIALLQYNQGKLAMVIRVIPQHIEELSPKMGLPRPVLERIQNPSGGFVLVCGPTGSGKTQIAMSIVDHYNSTQSGHIELIEDPSEHQLDSKKCVITQRQVGIDVESYAQGMVEAKRHNPSFVMAGEIRDRDTADASLNMGMSGAYMLATNHALTIPAMLRTFAGLASSGTNSANIETVYRMLGDSVAAVIRVALLNNAEGNGYYRVYDTMLNTGTARKFLSDGNLDKLEDLLASMNNPADSPMTSMNEQLHNLIKTGKVTRQEALAKTSNYGNLLVRLGGIK